MDWVQRLGLEPHPEGGYFRRIYTDARCIQTGDGMRAAASSIHYLLTRDSPVGHFHRNRSTILHYWQHGDAIEYWLLQPDGGLQTLVLGPGTDQQLFMAVPGGTWKASRLVPACGQALVSEVVLPGFEFADHEFLTAATLAWHYPQHVAALAGLVRRQ